MLLILILLAAFGNGRCDTTLSTDQITMEVGEAITFQVAISNNATVQNLTKVIRLASNPPDVIKVTPKEIVIDFESNMSSFTYNITLIAKQSGKSRVSLVTFFLEPDFLAESKLFVVVKIYKREVLQWISDTLGWLYFLAWSFSFYPQVYTNYKRKSVVGLSFDFVLFNLAGYLLYNAFNVGVYYIPVIKDQFLQRHATSFNPVHPNDIFFSVHSILITLVTIYQCFVYDKANQRVSTMARAIMGLYMLATLTFVALAGSDFILWLDALYLLSYTKLSITVSKYLPQVIMNYQRQTTQGWSIGSVSLDISGGILSIFQMVLDGYNYGDWKVVIENPTKFGLGLISLLFDIVFVVQHYVLYRSDSRVADNGITLKTIKKQEFDNTEKVAQTEKY